MNCAELEKPALEGIPILKYHLADASTLWPDLATGFLLLFLYHLPISYSLMISHSWNSGFSFLLSSFLVYKNP